MFLLLTGSVCALFQRVHVHITNVLQQSCWVLFLGSFVLHGYLCTTCTAGGPYVSWSQVAGLDALSLTLWTVGYSRQLRPAENTLWPVKIVVDEHLRITELGMLSYHLISERKVGRCCLYNWLIPLVWGNNLGRSRQHKNILCMTNMLCLLPTFTLWWLYCWYDSSLSISLDLTMVYNLIISHYVLFLSLNGQDLPGFYVLFRVRVQGELSVPDEDWARDCLRELDPLREPMCSIQSDESWQMS